MRISHLSASASSSVAGGESQKEDGESAVFVLGGHFVFCGVTVVIVINGDGRWGGVARGGMGLFDTGCKHPRSHLLPIKT